MFSTWFSGYAPEKFVVNTTCRQLQRARSSVTAAPQRCLRDYRGGESDNTAHLRADTSKGVKTMPQYLRQIATIAGEAFKARALANADQTDLAAGVR